MNETMGKLINRIPGSCLLISSLPEHMLNRSACLAMSKSLLKALSGKHDIKRHPPYRLNVTGTTK